MSSSSSAFATADTLAAPPSRTIDSAFVPTTHICPTRLIACFSSSVCCGSIGIATARFTARTACTTSSFVSSFESTLDAIEAAVPPSFTMQSDAAMTASTPPCFTSTSWPSLVSDTRCAGARAAA